MKDRPEIVEKRSRVGDYERDSIVSKGHKGGVLTIVDRASRLLRMSKVDRIASAVTHDKIFDWGCNLFCVTAKTIVKGENPQKGDTK